MIEQIYSDFVIACDICGHESMKFDTFDDAVDAKKSEGFSSKLYDNSWLDLCEDCQKQSAKIDFSVIE